MNNLKLTIELIPKGAWGNNLRGCLSQKDWDVLRNLTYQRSGYRCAICGNKDEKLQAHEVWDFDIPSKTQTLKDIIALCPACHGVKHMRNSERIGYGENSKRHFIKINNCDELTLASHMFESEELFNQRNKVYRWKLSLDKLTSLGGKGMTIKQRDIPMIVSPYENIDWSTIKYNNTKSLFKLSENRDNLGPPSVYSIEIDNYQGIITVKSKYSNKIEWISGSDKPNIPSRVMQTSYNTTGEFIDEFNVVNRDFQFICFRLTGDGGKTLSQLFELVP